MIGRRLARQPRHDEGAQSPRDGRALLAFGTEGDVLAEGVKMLLRERAVEEEIDAAFHIVTDHLYALQLRRSDATFHLAKLRTADIAA